MIRLHHTPIAAMMALLLLVASCTKGPESAPNVLLISIDTLRRDALGRYGGAETPFLDGLLAGGVPLDDHRSCSNWTLDAMTCVLSGRYAWDLDYAPSAGTALNEGRDVGGLPEGVELLADHLRAAGFDTALATPPTLRTQWRPRRQRQYRRRTLTAPRPRLACRLRRQRDNTNRKQKTTSQRRNSHSLRHQICRATRGPAVGNANATSLAQK